MVLQVCQNPRHPATALHLEGRRRRGSFLLPDRPSTTCPILSPNPHTHTFLPPLCTLHLVPNHLHTCLSLNPRFSYTHLPTLPTCMPHTPTWFPYERSCCLHTQCTTCCLHTWDGASQPPMPHTLSPALPAPPPPPPIAHGRNPSPAPVPDLHVPRKERVGACHATTHIPTPPPFPCHACLHTCTPYSQLVERELRPFVPAHHARHVYTHTQHTTRTVDPGSGLLSCLYGEPNLPTPQLLLLLHLCTFMPGLEAEQQQTWVGYGGLRLLVPNFCSQGEAVSPTPFTYHWLYLCYGDPQEQVGMGRLDIPQAEQFTPGGGIRPPVPVFYTAFLPISPMCVTVTVSITSTWALPFTHTHAAAWMEITGMFGLFYYSSNKPDIWCPWEAGRSFFCFWEAGGGGATYLHTDAKTLFYVFTFTHYYQHTHTQYPQYSVSIHSPCTPCSGPFTHHDGGGLVCIVFDMWCLVVVGR